MTAQPIDRPQLRVTAIRHGETTFNAEGLLTGQLDPALSPLGEAQAVSLAPVLAARHWDEVIHSGSRRTWDTLLLARGGTAINREPRTDPRLIERSFGELEGTPATNWTQPPLLDAAPPGGESYRSLGLRVFAALSDIAFGAEGQHVLICTHSGVMRMLRGIEVGACDIAELLGPGIAPATSAEFAYDALAVPAFLTES